MIQIAQRFARDVCLGGLEAESVEGASEAAVFGAESIFEAGANSARNFEYERFRAVLATAEGSIALYAIRHKPSCENCRSHLSRSRECKFRW